MDQWEFCVAYVDTHSRISADGVEFIRQSGEYRTTFVTKYLSAMGKDGWALNGIHLLRPDTAYYVLQRSLVAAPAAETPAT